MINTGEHIDNLMLRNPCKKHNAKVGEPCWRVPLGGGATVVDLRALCGSRIRAGGFDGQISVTSLSMKKSSNKKEVQR